MRTCTSHVGITVGLLLWLPACQTTSLREVTSSPDIQSSQKLHEQVAVLKKQTEERPTVSGWLNLARWQIASGRLQAAETSLNRVMERDFRNLEARLLRAQLLIRHRRAREARVVLESLRLKMPSDARVENALGMVATMERRPNVALSHFLRGQEIDPNDLAVQLNLGLVYLSYRQLDKAMIQFDRVLARNPSDLTARLHVAVAKGAAGDISAARELYADILDDRESEPLALYNLALLDGSQGRWERAVVLLDRFLATSNSDRQKKKARAWRVHFQQFAAGGKASDEEIIRLAAEADVAADKTTSTSSEVTNRKAIADETRKQIKTAAQDKAASRPKHSALERKPTKVAKNTVEQPKENLTVEQRIKNLQKILEE